MPDPDSSSDVISADRVDGTAVFGPDREKMGKIRDMLIGKRDGKVTDVIISVGEFLGLGGKLHSIPWSQLDYDVELGGYRLSVGEDQLRDAPTLDESDYARVHDRDWQQVVYGYYGVAPYW